MKEVYLMRVKKLLLILQLLMKIRINIIQIANYGYQTMEK